MKLVAWLRLCRRRSSASFGSLSTLNGIFETAVSSLLSPFSLLGDVTDLCGTGKQGMYAAPLERERRCNGQGLSGPLRNVGNVLEIL
jgi:hypothetical protein